MIMYCYIYRPAITYFSNINYISAGVSYFITYFITTNVNKQDT